MTPPRCEPDNLAAFLAALERAGIAYEVPSTSAAATFPWQARPYAIARPASRDQAAHVAALAGDYKCPIFPLSRGRNWGLGSRLPVHDAVVVDLSHLQEILDLDLVNGTARVEPGVTFEHLQTALAANGLAFHLPSFGGAVDASVLANALERGEGAGPAGDRFGGLFDLEVGLSTGERFRTGFARNGGELLARLHARPAGPLIEGLFSQSALGLVLSGRVTLAPTLHWAQALLFEFDTADAFARAVPVARNLVQSSVLHPHELAMWNKAKRISFSARGRAAVARAMAEPGMCWGMSLVVSAEHRAIFEARLSVIEDALQPLASRMFSASDRDADGARVETHLTGFSHGGNLVSAYAAKPDVGAEPLDPDRDRCGLFWLCPVAPFEAPSILAIERMIADVTEATSMFGALGLQAVSARALHAYVSVAWDRDDADADARAIAVHDALAARLREAGYLPFRLGLPTIATVPAAAPYAGVVERIAAALDPHGVMSPGKIPRG